jgi:hypothetical protein
MSTIDVIAQALEGAPLWGGLWIATLVIVVLRLQLLHYVLQVILEMVWIPWKLTKQMRYQGHTGPSFSLFTNHAQEMERLQKKAPSGPLLISSGINHDVVPRLLNPIHTWRNLYGV